jgi:hypothetical protein
MLRVVFVHIVLFSFVLDFIGQNEIVPLNNDITYPLENGLFKNHESNFHSGVKPFIKSEVEEVSDTMVEPIGWEIGDGSKLSNLRFSPILDVKLINQMGQDFRYSYAGGIGIESNIGKRIGLSGFYAYANAPRFDYLDSSILIRNSVNGMGFDLGDNTVHYSEFYVNIKANDHFSFTLGNGKNFWGDGYRSMMLSDNAAPYPFFRIMSSFWNVKYTNLYSMHTDTYNGKIQRKFATSHQLSWNILKNLNLTVFESVVFIGDDTLSQRGFDVNYLNPVVFYRPIEYAQGSSDNVLLGASMKYVFKEKHVAYGQFVLDEFLLSEYRTNNGWWANKFAAQIGLKAFDFAGINDLCLQTEVNFIRPFTFAHNTSLLNYGHQGQSLAHPLGANFHESVTRLRYQLKKWFFEAKVIYIDRGEDYNSVSYGGDIFRSYTLREGEYGHEIGQGENHYIWYNELKVAYNVIPKMNLRAFASFAFRSDKSNQGTENLNLIQIGITSSLWNTYSDY